MKDRDDSTQNLLEELLEQAVREGKLEAPLAVELRAEREQQPAARALGVIQDLGNTLSGPVSSMVNQAAGKSGTSWLKWLNPIAGVISLFTGRKKEEELPAPVMSPRLPKRSVEYGLVASEGGVFLGTDRDEAGRARMVENRVEGAAAASQVVVQVQAMDSRSFLDHRDEIASAVRQALMESHGLGTVLREFQE